MERIYVVSIELVNKYGLTGIVEDAWLSGRTIIVDSSIYDKFINMMNIMGLKMKVKVA